MSSKIFKKLKLGIKNKLYSVKKLTKLKQAHEPLRTASILYEYKIINIENKYKLSLNLLSKINDVRRFKSHFRYIFDIYFINPYGIKYMSVDYLKASVITFKYLIIT